MEGILINVGATFDLKKFLGKEHVWFVGRHIDA